MVQLANKPELILPNPERVRERIEALDAEANLLRRFYRVLIQVADNYPANQIECAEATATGGTHAARR